MTGPSGRDTQTAAYNFELGGDSAAAAWRSLGPKMKAAGLCGNLAVLDENGERFHCDCRADDWVEGDNGAIRCERCGGYAGELERQST